MVAPERPHAVLAFRMMTSLRLHKLLARRLIKFGWRVTFLFWDDDNDTVPRARQEANGLAPFASLDEFPDDGSPRLQFRKSHPSPLRAQAAKAFLKVFGNPEIAVYRSLHERVIAKSFAALGRLNPSVVIATEDGVSSNFRFLAVARQLQIPIVVVPHAFHSQFHYDIDLEQKKRRGDLRLAVGNGRRALRLLAPQWLKAGELTDAVMFPPAFILAAEALGASVPNPWTMQGGVANALCVESEVMMQHFVREGVSRSKLVLTGSPYADEVVDSLMLDARARAAFRQPRWIEAGRARVLVSTIPNRHGDRAQFSEFPTYHDMTREMFRRLRALDSVTVTVSLHPSCPPETRSLIESEGFSFSDEDFIGLIARHDVLVTAYSSARRWAFASGKPMISYDAYCMEHGQFEAPGFITTRSLDEFSSHVARITKSLDAFRDLAAPQCEQAESWGAMDGQCSTRIAALIEQLGAASQRGRPAAAAC